MRRRRTTRFFECEKQFSFLMHRGIYPHMTSRNKGLLEEVVSSLWELETARMRQERLVQGVLAAGHTEKERESLKWQQVSIETSASGFVHRVSLVYE